VKGGIFAFDVCGFVTNAWQHPPKEVPPFALKKGAVNTPSVISFFSNENGGFDFIYQNRRRAVVFVFGRKIPTASITVFFIYRRAVAFFALYLFHFGPT
jgi:hypothetical protein